MAEFIPRIPGVADHIDYLRFLNDRKAFDKYHKQLVDQMEKLSEMIAVHGKAKDIEKLYAEAEELRDKVLSEIERREAALKAEREAFQKEMADGRKALREEQARRTDELNSKHQEAQASLAAAKAAETAAEDARKAAEADRERAAADRERVQALRKELDEQAELGRQLMRAR